MRELKAPAGRAHVRREQRQWLATIGATGVMGSILLSLVRATGSPAARGKPAKC